MPIGIQRTKTTKIVNDRRLCLNVINFLQPSPSYPQPNFTPPVLNNIIQRHFEFFLYKFSLTAWFLDKDIAVIEPLCFPSPSNDLLNIC